MKTNKSDKAASGFWKRMRFHWNRGRGHLARYLWNRVRWHVYPRLRMPGGYPDHVDLELSSACNMACPMCYTTTQDFKKRVPHLSMDFALFRKIVDELADHRVYSIRLSWRGEPTLNRHFIDCLRYAKQRGIREVDSLTNALRLTPQMFEQLVDLKMDWLTISFDGTGETYERIRKPARFAEMRARISEFAEIKRKKRSGKPVIRIQGIWPAIAQDPEAYFDTFEPIADEISVNSLLDYLHTDKDIQFLEDFTCPVPFQRLAIGSDGRAFMCVNDELGSHPVGDARTQSIYEIWNGRLMREVREVHKRGEGYETFGSCKMCYQPRKTIRASHQVGNRTIYLDELVGKPQIVGK